MADHVLGGTSLLGFGRAGGARLEFLGCADHPTSLSPSTAACATCDIHIVTPVPLFPGKKPQAAR